MINDSGLLYLISKCHSGVNLKNLVWPGRGWTFFILLWQGFIPYLPHACFITPEIVFSMESCFCEATASALRPDGFLLWHDKILSVYFFYSVYRLFQHYTATSELNRNTAELKLNVLREYAETNGIFMCMYC